MLRLSNISISKSINDFFICSRAQYAVLQKLGIKKVFAVVGFSMGGQQVS